MTGGRIGAVVLAAGRSHRMGSPKPLLPWRGSTVIQAVVSGLAQAGVDEIVVVTNSALLGVWDVLAGGPAKVLLIPDNLAGEMLVSAQAGLRALSAELAGALIALGDQPQIEPLVPVELIRVFRSGPAQLVAPSHAMRRGHPWLIARALWPAILALPTSSTMRDFLDARASEIRYVEFATASILMDVDTPEDYHALNPD